MLILSDCPIGAKDLHLWLLHESWVEIGVSDGIRTRDVQSHSLALYQAELRSPQTKPPISSLL